MFIQPAALDNVSKHLDVSALFVWFKNNVILSTGNAYFMLNEAGSISKKGIALV